MRTVLGTSTILVVRSIAPAGTDHTPDPSAPAVVLGGVEVRYGGRRALDIEQLELPRGSIVAVIGPNGSGKSTLLSTIAGLVEPSSGRVEVLGRAPADARSDVAYVLQVTNPNELVPLTVREVVTMGRYARLGPFRPLRRVDRRAVERALDRLGLAGLANRQLSELSGGERQRVYVAQGLVQEADLLLLDEPVTGLDLPTQQRLDEIVVEERGADRTVVHTTHNVAHAASADVVVLLGGRLVATGPPEEVVTTERLADAYEGQLHVTDEGALVIDDPHHVHGEHPREHVHSRRPGDPAH